MADLPPIANAISNFLLALLIITFIYALCIRFITDVTLYDLCFLPTGDPRKIAYYVEPLPSPDDPLLFPSVFDPPSLALSIVIPASNNEFALPIILDSVLGEFRPLPNNSWEVIIADDCSTDRTRDIALEYGRDSPNVRLLRQPRALGLGAALQAGALHARGRLILAVSADLAIKIEEFVTLEKKLLELKEGNPSALVFGSRAHIPGFSLADGDLLQRLLRFAGAKGARETDFPLKLFSREAAQWLFPNQHTAFCSDPELLAVAMKKAMAVTVVPIAYGGVEPPLVPRLTVLRQAVDLLQVGLLYRFNMWTVRLKGSLNSLQTGV
jgi:dolichyl-phosphate beta-glucosyltransferase